jgi:hypothetical protein
MNSRIPHILPEKKYSSKTDPILLELWEIKRQMNEGAQFDITKLARQANQFDLKKTLERLRTPI